MKDNLTDSKTIQRMIDNSIKEGKKEVYITRNPDNKDGDWCISEVIKLPSNITVYIKDCKLKLADGVYCNIFCNKYAYQKSSESTKEQSNINLIGIGNAVLDGGNHNGLVESTSGKDGRPHIIYNTGIFFRNLNKFSVKNIHITNPRWWGMTFMYCKNGNISDIEFSAYNNVPNQDGIDLRVGCSNIIIRNISGLTGDDSIALTALTGRLETMLNICDRNRDIHDIKIRNINTEVTGGHHIIRLLNHDGNCLYNIEISNVFDKTLKTGGIRAKAALKIGDKNYSHVRKAKTGETRSIKVNNIKTRAQYAVLIGNSNVTQTEFTDIKNKEGTLIHIN